MANEEPRSRGKQPWYRHLFDGFYYDVWFRRGASDEAQAERTAAEVTFLVQALARPPGAALLDLACGHGRHAIALAERGYRVTDLDLSASHLALARQAAAAQGVAVTWVQADMRDLAAGPFNAVINLFSAFGISCRMRPTSRCSLHWDACCGRAAGSWWICATANTWCATFASTTGSC